MENNIKKQLEFIKKFFNIYENKDFFIEFRIFEKRGLVARKFFSFLEIYNNSIEVEYFLKQNQKNNIYFGVLPRTLPEGTAKAVEFGKVLWLDLDVRQENPKEKLAEILRAIQQKGFIEPNIIVFSGAGFHFYYILEEELPKEEIKELEEKLVEFFASIFPNYVDKQVRDLARIMRLPYSLNVKYNKPIPTEVVKFNLFPYPKNYFKEFFKLLEKKELKEIDVDVVTKEFNRRMKAWQRKRLVDFFSNFWVQGYRNQLEISLVGLLMKNNVKFEHTYNIIKQICEKTGDEEIKSRLKNVEYHYKHRAELLEKLKGVSGIQEIIWDILNSDIESDAPLFKKWKEMVKKGLLIKDDIDTLVKQKLKSFGLLKTEKISLLERAYKLSDLMNMDVKEIKYIVEPLLPENSLVILAGKPSSFKSFFALDLSLSIALGKPFLNKFPTTKKKVLYIDAENGVYETARRIKNLLGDVEVNEENFLYIEYQDVEHLRSQIEKLDFDVVIFDSMRRFLKGDESKSEVINKFYMNVLVPLKNSGKTIILIHHLRKKTQVDLAVEDMLERIRGSSDIGAMIDLAYVLDVVDQNIDVDMKISQYIVNTYIAKRRLNVKITDFSFIVEENEKLKKTELRFNQLQRVLTKEELVKEKIAEILKDAGKEMKTKEILEAVSEALGEEVDKMTFNRAKNKLLIAGTIIQVRRGVYKYNEKLLERFL